MSRYHWSIQHTHLMIHPKIWLGTVSACIAACATSACADNNPLNFDQVIGLYVDIQNSAECGGSNSDPQKVTAHARISGGNRGGCPVKLAITVTGIVEAENAAFDFVYVNDVLFFSGDENYEGCEMTTKTVTKVVTVDPSEEITLTYDTGDGQYTKKLPDQNSATITAVELVEESCSSGCEAGGGTLENGSIHVNFNIGRADFGQSVGALRIAESVPNGVLGTPASLRYSSAWDGVEVIHDSSEAIRQVKTPQCLADVVTETADRFRVDFYDANNIGARTNGLYDQTAQIRYTSWIIENVDILNNDHLKVTQVKGASSIVNEFIWDAVAQGWELREGNNQRKEIKTSVDNAPTQTRTVTTVVKNAADQAVSKSVETYKDFAWGRELIESVADPDGAALTTTRTFYDNSATDGGAYTKPKEETRPDGGWARYEYDALGRRIKTVEPFLDADLGSDENLCKVTTFIYKEEKPQETRVVTILGQEVERGYKVNSDDIDHITKDIVCTVPGAAYGAATNLVTLTKLVADGAFIGEIERVENPDGTGRTYQYSKTATAKTTVVSSGAMDAGTVVSGTQTTTTTDLAGNLIAEMVVDIASDETLSVKTVTASDSFGRPTVIDYNDGTTETINYGCCGVESRTDREGITTSYTYDAFKRVLTEARAGVTTSYGYDAEGRVIIRKRIGSIGSNTSEMVLETNVYDLAGRVVSTTDALNHSTGYTYSIDINGRHFDMITRSDGGTDISTRYKDGRVFSISGAAAAPRKWLYGVDTGVGFYSQEIKIGDGGSETEWTKTWQDHAGRTVQQQLSGQTPSMTTYDNTGHIVQTVDPDGVTMLFSYDAEGRLVSEALDINRNGIVDDPDQVNLTSHQVLLAHGETVQRTETSVINNDGVEELASRVDISSDSRRQWITQWGLQTTNFSVLGASGTRTDTITNPDGSTRVRSYAQGRLTTEIQQAGGSGPRIKSIAYAYDPHGRLQFTTDALNGITTFTYDAMDRFLSVSTPAPGPNLAAQTTTNTYDSMGRVTAITHPDNSQTLRTYFLTGALHKISGSQTPTVEYTYDPQGRIKTMVTTGQSGPATTTWNYDSTTGWLQTKSHPGGNVLTYTYTQAGRALTRSSEREITRTYLYDNGARQTGIDYSDGTPNISYTLNRLGQIVGITDASGTRNLAVTTSGQVQSETHNEGLLNGATITNSHNALLRRNAFSVTTDAQPFGVGFTYDGYSRLATVVSGTDTSTYNYQTDSSLLGSVTTARNNVTSLTTNTSYDYLERLTAISGSNGTTTISSNAYSYNNLNQRLESVLEDGSKWTYQYDGMGQVIAGNKLQAGNVPVAGSQFGYAFDGIGNRTSATVNGRVGSYTANTANQYTQRQVPGFIDIRGTAIGASKVTVNHQATQRQGDTFYKAFAVDNSAAPQFQEIKVLAVQNNVGSNGEDLQSESVGKMFLPQTPEIFTQDQEGNITSDGRWNYTWDAENRLIGQETIATVPVAAKHKLEYAYDSNSRRIRKQAWHWDGTDWAMDLDRRFLYDGWNLVAELDSNNTMLRNFVWGSDLSGTMQGAGGVGGLLAIREGTESYHPAFDGNGNITALVKASDHSVAARYQYGPFGETLVVEENGVSNPFRFSTKYYDAETGLYYYGFRYYNPVTGRWLSRDLIGEKGGVNLYVMLRNDPVNDADILGLESKRDCTFTIRAGHGSLDPKNSPVETGAPKPQPGNRCTAVSCFSKEINTRLPGSVPYDGETLGFLPGDETAYKALENAIATNKKQAEQDCSTDKCGCKTITVKVECPGGAGRIDFQGLATDLKKKPLCGQTYTINCKSKTWK